MRRTVLFCLVAYATFSPIEGQASFEECVEIERDEERLACFDAAARGRATVTLDCRVWSDYGWAIHQKPSQFTPKVEKMKENKKYVVLEQTVATFSFWFKIEENGRVGWVIDDHIEVNGDGCRR